ncbi:hypothetical protein A4A49_53343 [Nicotiana attenuata]|uniref:Uncharacterized protein n=1 Tax=Nicotiana attenuata TaxID=49451 RepID=A0A314LF55_NICAT|nr:hypothetical protein A4A49_53343 [Nicotiana attenuata]
MLLEHLLFGDQHSALEHVEKHYKFIGPKDTFIAHVQSPRESSPLVDPKALGLMHGHDSIQVCQHCVTGGMSTTSDTGFVKEIDLSTVLLFFGPVT